MGPKISANALRIQGKAVEFVKAFFDAGKPVAVICHGTWTVIETGATQTNLTNTPAELWNSVGSVPPTARSR
jgi:protease I